LDLEWCDFKVSILSSVWPKQLNKSPKIQAKNWRAQRMSVQEKKHEKANKRSAEKS
jgi:hypothetical protein